MQSSLRKSSCRSNPHQMFIKEEFLTLFIHNYSLSLIKKAVILQRNSNDYKGILTFSTQRTTFSFNYQPFNTSLTTVSNYCDMLDSLTS